MKLSLHKSGRFLNLLWRNRTFSTLALLIVTVASMLPAKAGVPAQVVTVVVVRGDTLWQIARTYGSENEDVRRTIYRIMKINGMTSSDIHPGDKLVVPIDAQ